MKRFKLSILVLTLSSFIVLNAVNTFSYFNNIDNTGMVTFTMGNIKVQTDNTPENVWKYVPINVQKNSNDANDLVDASKLSSNIKADNLRPGDAFEKNITITNTGLLNSRVKISKGNMLKESPFKLMISLKEHGSEVSIKQDPSNSEVWYIDNLKSKDKVVFTIRLEIPIQVTNVDINSNNFTLSNDALELLDIIATQWNNPSWSE